MKTIESNIELETLNQNELKKISGGGPLFEGIAWLVGSTVAFWTSDFNITSYEYGDEVAPGIIYGVHTRD